jgi:hypothetical protein
MPLFSNSWAYECRQVRGSGTESGWRDRSAIHPIRVRPRLSFFEFRTRATDPIGILGRTAGL